VTQHFSQSLSEYLNLCLTESRIQTPTQGRSAGRLRDLLRRWRQLVSNVRFRDAIAIARAVFTAFARLVSILSLSVASASSSSPQ
jgi:hypothetical protein